MSKKPSLSIQCKQSQLLRLHNNSNTHSLSKKKQFLTIVTPSQHQYKRIKTLKQIKRIAQGIKTTAPPRESTEVVINRKVIPTKQIHSFISETNSWRKDLTIDIKPIQTSQKCMVDCSARTMATKFEASRFNTPQTPINRLMEWGEYDD